MPEEGEAMIPLNLADWAARHGVSPEAMGELSYICGVDAQTHGDAPKNQTPEGYVQSQVRLEAPARRCYLWRNNVGVLRDKDDRPVRYGLANDTKALNERLKSSDLIGWRPVTIQAHHVGRTIAQFLARECKAADWVWRGTDRERAQLAWIQLVQAQGGDASFTTGPGSL